jgi:2-hydroxycyclohexanecarboxyl-CoA dehydrogenase
VIGVNLGGVINGLQTFVPRMLARGDGGHIVNTSSGAGLVDGGTGFLYHASKFGVVGLSESLRGELRQHGIGVSVLCPAAVATEIMATTRSLTPEGVEGDDPALAPWREELVRGVHQGVSPDAVGELVLDAIEVDRAPWIFTDDVMRPLIAARAEALLDAVPHPRP